MNKINYDFHIHSCLSPCGDADMTPCNIAGMASLKGLDIIALTDHNTCLNAPAAVKAGERMGVTVIPGMELCTSEEIHVVCLFKDVKSALEFSGYVKTTLPPITNDEGIFGPQVIMDEDDNITGGSSLFLAGASGISVYEVLPLVREYGGTAFPAHADKHSYSIISMLGEIPPDLPFKSVELSPHADIPDLFGKYPALKEKQLLFNSDAHYLPDINEPPEGAAGAFNSPVLGVRHPIRSTSTSEFASYIINKL